MPDQRIADVFRDHDYPKVIIYTHPDDHARACHAAREVVAELHKKKPNRKKFHWGSVRLIEFSDGQVFQVKINKKSVSVWRIT